MSSSNAFHLVMELMDGGSLLDAMKRFYKENAAHTMPPAALATIGVDVLGALEFLQDDLQVMNRDGRDNRDGPVISCSLPAGGGSWKTSASPTSPARCRLTPEGLVPTFAPCSSAAPLTPRVDRHHDLHVA